MSVAFKRVTIIPNYVQGFTFTWQMHNAFADPRPWNFTVQEAQVPDGPWTTISPVLPETYVWEDQTRRVVNKDPQLYFRISVTTAANKTYYSEVIAPYGDFHARREYLIVRDIMRREILQAREMAGILGRVWLKAREDDSTTACTECTDPVTGSIINTNCDECLGTGIKPPYFGPYTAWLTFSTEHRRLKMSGDGTGSRQPRDYSVRMIGAPHIRPGDIVVDPAEDKRYDVDEVRVLTEIRRIPVVQELLVKELPVTDPAYRLGDSGDDIADIPTCEDD